MNYIQTLYIDSSKNPLKNSFGWARPEYHLMSWALSCLQLKKIYGNVELYANNTAAELLINDLKLPNVWWACGTTQIKSFGVINSHRIISLYC